MTGCCFFFLLSSCRFCGSVAPPTVNTNSSTVWVTFHSDGSIAGGGFSAQYRAVLPGQSQCHVCNKLIVISKPTKNLHLSVCLCVRGVFVWLESCSREEFMCDRGRCLLPVSVCDGHPNCQDQSDEANCSHKHKGERIWLKIKFKKKLRISVYSRIGVEENSG